MELKLCARVGRNIQIYPREFWERVENYFILKPQEIAVGNSILRKVSEENFNLLPRVLRDYQDGVRNQSKKSNVTEFFKRNLKINKNRLSFRLWSVFYKGCVKMKFLFRWVFVVNKKGYTKYFSIKKMHPFWHFWLQFRSKMKNLMRKKLVNKELSVEIENWNVETEFSSSEKN